MENVGSSQKTENVAASFSSQKETHTLRKSGIEVVEDVPWGTHLCQFYETKEDLIDIFVPYFKAGLENNEFCMWVTSEPLSSKEAEKAMRKAVPNLDRYLKRGQIEIVPHTEWYLKDGAFNLERVLNAWVDKLNQALPEGYDGIRVTGNTAWLEKKDWKNFTDYEEAVNNVIGKYRMMAICTYSLGKCGAVEVIDVIRNHQFALIRRRDEWELIESSELKQAKGALIRSETRLRNIFAASPDAITVSDLNGNIVECNQATLDMGGLSSKDKVIGKSALEFIAKKDHKRAIENLKKTIEQGSVKNIEYTFLAKDGREYPAELSSSVIKDSSGNPTGFVAITKDITEHKKAEKALRESEEKYKQLIENVGAPVTYFDVNGQVLLMNTVAARALGGEPEDFTGKNLLDLFPPDMADKYLKRFKDIDKTAQGGEFEDLVELPSGSQWFGSNIQPVTDTDGHIFAVQIISYNITERKKIEEKLQDAKEKWVSLMENTDDVIMVVDGKGVIQYINRTIPPYTPNETVGKLVYDYVPKEQHDVMRESLRKVFKTGKPDSFKVSSDIPKIGAMWFRAKVVPIRHGKEIPSVVMITTDITERKKAEEAVRKSGEKYRGIVELAPDGIATMDIKGVVTSVNTAFSRLTGYSKDEIVGKHFTKLGTIRPRDLPKYIKLLSSIFRGKIPPSLEFVYLRKDGTQCYGEARLSLMKQSGKEVGVQAILRDITERKNMEEKLKRYTDHLEELVEERTRELKESQDRLIKSERFAAIGELATMVAHDLRNPLTSIRTAGYYIKNTCPYHAKPECKTAIEMLDIIEKETLFADNIINDLLDFATKRPLQKKKQNINNLLETSVIVSNIPENIKIKRKSAKKAIAIVDAKQFERVFLNLTKNAVQAMQNGGKLTIKTSETKNHIEITFTDTGVGIPEGNISKLFTPLFTTKAKGIGMGLAICKRIVEQHGCTINVRSKVGKGTTVTIKLPKKGGENNQ